MKLFSKIKSSLSLKLWVIFIISTIALVLILFIGIGNGFKHHFASNIKNHIDAYATYISEDIGTTPDYQRAKEIADELNIVIKIKTQDKVWSSNNDLNPPKTKRGRHSNHYQPRFFSTENSNTVFYFIPGEHRKFDSDKIIWLIIALAMLALWLSHYFISRQFRPIKHEIKQGLNEFSQGNLQHRISIKQQDELGVLAQDINTMAAKLEELLKSKQDLLLAVSHELRSPLTRSKLSIEMMDDSTTKTSIQEDINELQTIIDDILNAERLKSGQTVLNKTPTDMKSLVANLINTYFKTEDIQINLSENIPNLLLDDNKIKLLIKNLLENALRYNRSKIGKVTLSVRYDKPELVITVKDYGKGIKPKHIDKLTAAFYRPDSSRTRDTGGLGLGLYLCANTAKAHGGYLEIKSTIEQGAKFSVTIPAKLTTG